MLLQVLPFAVSRVGHQGFPHSGSRRPEEDALTHMTLPASVPLVLSLHRYLRASAPQYFGALGAPEPRCFSAFGAQTLLASIPSMPSVPQSLGTAVLRCPRASTPLCFGAFGAQTLPASIPSVPRPLRALVSRGFSAFGD
ncbi:UNVERIFIED_CONTAM: hypothetical protein FKN15_017547 [Acipenser sinensis]